MLAANLAAICISIAVFVVSLVSLYRTRVFNTEITDFNRKVVDFNKEIVAFNAKMAALAEDGGRQIEALAQANALQTERIAAAERQVVEIGNQQRHEILTAAHIRTYYADLRRFGEETVDAMAEAVFVCDLGDASVAGNATRIESKLSALLDRGRLFLPNEKVTGFGENKEAAFQGFRNAVLDPIKASLPLVRLMGSSPPKGRRETENADGNVRAQLVEKKREFISRIQGAAKVRELLEVDKALKKQYMATLLRSDPDTTGKEELTAVPSDLPLKERSLTSG